MEFLTTRIMQKYIGKHNSAAARQAAESAGKCEVFVIDNVVKYLTKTTRVDTDPNWTDKFVFEKDGFRTPYPYTSFEFKTEVGNTNSNDCVIFEPPTVVEGVQQFHVLYFTEIKDQGIFPLCRGKFLVIPDGIPRNPKKGEDEVTAVYEVDPGFLKAFRGKGQNDSLLVDWFRCSLWFCQYTNLLLSCKNIRREVRSTHAGLTKRQRKEIPCMDYHVLNVPLINRIASGEEVRGEGGKMPLSRVRGHFKNYTAERPLLGRHVGRWWWDDHATGNAAYGIVEKDYSVSVGEPSCPSNEEKASVP